MGKRAKSSSGGAPLLVIGWREYVDLPDWGIEHVVAKADTGARTGAIDVSNIEELPGDRVRFEVMVDRGQPRLRKSIETAIVRRTRVKSSFGQRHDRFFVETRVRIGPHEFAAELGLVSRRNMLCRMLLGRLFLKDRFAVDSGRQYLVGKRRRRPPRVKPDKGP